MDFMNLTVSVIGGDSRLIYTAKRLKEMGLSVVLAGMELYEPAPGTDLCEIDEALERDVLLFGLPFSKNGETLHAPFHADPVPIDAIMRRLHSDQIVFAGMLSPANRLLFTSCGVTVCDYFKDDALTLYNAMLTAEALTGLLIRKLPCSLFGARIAITGYGRIGFYLARILKQLGAAVTVFARSELQLAKAKTVGLRAKPLRALREEDHSFRALINTVPAAIVQTQELSRLNRDCILIEAASAPYGISEKEASQSGFSFYLASGLPGKYAPESAGAFIADTAVKMLREVNT